MQAGIEEFDVLVRKIKMDHRDDARMAFDAMVLDWRPVKKEWVQTKQRITCTGYFYNLVENDHLHVRAEEVEDSIYGLQWQIYASERVIPGTVAEMEKFLNSVRGIGPALARRLVDAFGLDVISKVMEDASCLNTLSLPQPAKDSLYAAIVENQSFEQLLMFLQGHDLAPKYTAQIYNMYGSNAVDKICDNPYALYLDDVIDFPAAARLDAALGNQCLPEYRIQAGVLGCLRDDSERNGNLYIEESDLPSALERYFRHSARDLNLRLPATEELDDALYKLATDRYIVIDSTLGEGRPVYLTANFYAETNIADRLCTLMQSVKNIRVDPAKIKAALTAQERDTGFTLTREQRAAVVTALSSPVSILTGGPGTGKTQTLTMLVATARKLFPSIDIRICAPTGKAAVRAQELTNVEASTIHRAIGYPQAILKEDELVCDLLIADEYSMCDAQLCSWLFRALSSGARLLMVGDHEQLPSVGPGLVLRDLMDTGIIPVTRLTQIMRQTKGSNIAQNAKNIISAPEGADFELTFSDAPGGDFYLVEADNQRKIRRMVAKSIHRMLDEGFPASQIAVLSPIHGGLVGTDSLNNFLQEDLNPETAGFGCTSYQLASGGELRVGDKVIQTHNDYDLSVFNGETGVVKALDYAPSKCVCVDFGTKDVWYNAEQADNLDLAYSITTHRSQGSEFQAVIIPICDSLLFNVNKNVMYTAITRAKKRVVFVGTEQALYTALKKGGAMKRCSHLMLRVQTKMLAE